MSGYGLARNSSKVMAPPGGYCSDIFGTSTHNAQPPAAQRAQPEARATRSPTRQPNPTADYAKEAAARQGQSQIFQAAAPQESSAQMPTAAASPARVRPEAMQYDQMAQEVRTDVRTGTRVVQPPGGRCSNIFG